MTLKYYDVKINTWDENSKPIKNLTKADIKDILFRIEDELLEKSTVDFQCEQEEFTINPNDLKVDGEKVIQSDK